MEKQTCSELQDQISILTTQAAKILTKELNCDFETAVVYIIESSIRNVEAILFKEDGGKLLTHRENFCNILKLKVDSIILEQKEAKW